MKSYRSLVTFGLLALIVLAIVGLVLTRDSGLPTTGGKTAARRGPIVDEKPVQTASAIAKLASSWEEQRFGQQALKLADHEVDLAFADALRDAAERPLPTTPESRELYGRVNKAEAQVKADQNRVDALKKELAGAGATRQSSIQQQLDIVQAQLELDQDELDDAKGDLNRSGIDPLSRIRRQFSRRQAAQQTDNAHPQPLPSNSQLNYGGGNLLDHFANWRALRNKNAQLQKAQADAIRSTAALSQAHDTLEKQVGGEQADQQALAQEASTQLASGQAADSAGASGETAAALFSLHALSVDQKDLSDLDKRIQDQTALGDAYGNWIALVNTNQRVVFHGALKSALWILLIVLAMYLANALVERVFTDANPEHTRFRTLRVVVRFAVQAVGIVFLLFVVFGVPNQISTILGLAGAGLTVALKDFIVAFFGWFVLMGRNGIRVGDWVEINGVVGEVVEINLMRTVLLETGNWTDTGHPTGRKVAFMNSYAIEGHFFNFSTSGQWLWDELELTVPADRDPYPVIESIQKLVAKETEANARMAQEEWQRVTTRYHLRSISATPAVNLRPTGSGVEVHIRYISRANERYATRAHLYQALVELLHRRGVEPAISEAAPVSG